MKILFTGGGTGGHVYPAIAIAKTIKSRCPDAEIAFVGTSKGIENKICQKEGFPIYHVEIMGVKRSLSLSNAKALYYCVTSPGKAKKIIDEFKPDAVIGTGGYVCWPTCKAASKAGIPTVLHESNAFPGLAVKKLQDHVDKILLNFSECANGIKSKNSDKLLTVGNPLRNDFSTLKKEKARELLGITGSKTKVVLSYGGSRGAGKVNETVVELMRLCTAEDPDVIHIHATGEIGKEKFKEKFKEYGLDSYSNLCVYDYIEDMPVKMAAADVVICRAGAMTVSEIALMGKTAIFIPSPNVTDNHQYKNAKVLADKDAAVVIEEKDLTPERLAEKVRELLKDDKKREEMSLRVREFSDPNANAKIYDEIVRLIKEKNRV